MHSDTAESAELQDSGEGMDEKPPAANNDADEGDRLDHTLDPGEEATDP